MKDTSVYLVNDFFNMVSDIKANLTVVAILLTRPRTCDDTCLTQVAPA